jgi:hypothetical protein
MNKSALQLRYQGLEENFDLIYPSGQTCIESDSNKIEIYPADCAGYRIKYLAEQYSPARNLFYKVTRFYGDLEKKKGRYGFPVGSGSVGTQIFIPPALYKRQTVENLNLTEGYLKALVSTHFRFNTIGFSSVTHSLNKGELHQELLTFIKTKNVKYVNILADPDILDYREKLSNKEHYLVTVDSYQLYKGFYNFLFKTAEKIKELGIEVKCFITRDGKIDDLLISGKIPEYIEITNQLNFIESVESFYSYFEKNIGSEFFLYRGQYYKYDGNSLFRFDKIFNSMINVAGDYYKIHDSEILKIKPTFLADLLGRNNLKYIRKYFGFTIDFTRDYKETSLFNTYNKLKWNSNQYVYPGETLAYLERIYPNEKIVENNPLTWFDFILDYIYILLFEPYQPLPVIIQVSKAQGTGKSRFVDTFLDTILQGNTQSINADALLKEFNSSLFSCDLVLIEEACFNKRELKEVLKNYTDSTFVTVRKLYSEMSKVRNGTKFILNSNSPEYVLNVQDTDSRFLFKEFKKLDIQIDKDNLRQLFIKERDGFINYIKKRGLVSQRTSRIHFDIEILQNEQFAKTVEASQSKVIKELKELINTYFETFPEEDNLKMTLDDIASRLKIERSKLKGELLQAGYVPEVKASSYYFFYTGGEYYKNDKGHEVKNKTKVAKNGFFYMFNKPDDPENVNDLFT